MLQPTKSGKNRKEKNWRWCNILNNNELQNFLITRVFATHFAVGCFYASFERLFVKKIQHLFFSKSAFHSFYIRHDLVVFLVSISLFNNAATLFFVRDEFTQKFELPVLCLNNNCYICHHNIEYPNIDEYSF